MKRSEMINELVNFINNKFEEVGITSTGAEAILTFIENKGMQPPDIEIMEDCWYPKWEKENE